ncbi:MAG: thiamine-phosphate kinase [Tidjanibacter sp.]|nr:thiamine-phosphate kinase [Tidjanibacter sp.]
MKGEFELIDFIRGHFSEVPQGVVGIGDDCAIIGGECEEWLFSTDLVMEGVHFLRTKSSPEDVGWKAAAVNLSDIAAMGGEPVATFLSIALPREARGEWAERFVEGYASISNHYGVPLLGGDTTSSLRDVAVNVGVLGKSPKGSALLRSGARVGDTIFVTGMLGDSGAGLRLLLGDHTPDDATAYLTAKHNRPTPRIAEGIALRKSGKVGAMMDISDGIASDLRHILKASGVGAWVELRSLPLSPQLKEVCEREGWNAQELAISAGEDYELLLTAPEELADELSFPLYPIGKITEKVGEIEWYDGGKKVALDTKGFTHF